MTFCPCVYFALSWCRPSDQNRVAVICARVTHQQVTPFRLLADRTPFLFFFRNLPDLAASTSLSAPLFVSHKWHTSQRRAIIDFLTRPWDSRPPFPPVTRDRGLFAHAKLTEANVIACCTTSKRALLKIMRMNQERTAMIPMLLIHNL